MLQIPLHSLFHFGTVVRYLQDARPGHRLADDEDGGRRIRSNLQLVFTYMNDLSLQKSLRSESTARLRELFQQFAPADNAAVLSAEQFATLDTNISALRTTLENELQEMYAYSLTPGRLPRVVPIEDAASLSAPNAYPGLPRSARLDVSEAARCLACEVPTAAAFHLIRAVDVVVQAFYLSPVSTRRKVDHNELFARLDRIRTGFTNPLQHSSAVFNLDEAQRLWELAIDVINRIAEGLDANASGRSENLRPQLSS